MTTGIQTLPRRVRLASVIAGLLSSTTAIAVIGMAGVVPTAAAYANTRDSGAGRAVSGSTLAERAPSSSLTRSKYYVNTFATAYGFLSPHCMDDDSQHCRPQGELFAAPSNYVFCKTWGDKVGTSSQYNHWWLLTDLDRVYPGKSGTAYVSAYYLRNWGNDVAKDNSGRVIPNC
jgi:hypothetical protein